MLQVDGKQAHLGTFESEEAAARKYDEYAVEQGKPLNFSVKDAPCSTEPHNALSLKPAAETLSGQYDKTVSPTFVARAARVRAQQAAAAEQNARDCNRLLVSRYKGVSWATSRKMWVARITYDGTTKILGAFHDEKEAARKYDETASSLGRATNLSANDSDTEVLGKRKLTNKSAHLCMSNLKEAKAHSASKPTSAENYRGVRWDEKWQKFSAEIHIDGLRTILGHFSSAREAARKYDEHAVIFGRETNFSAQSAALRQARNTRVLSAAENQAIGALNRLLLSVRYIGQQGITAAPASPLSSSADT